MRRGTIGVAIFAVALGLTTTAFAWVSVFPTGVTINDPAQVQPGYVIFNANSGESFAVSTDGVFVRTWVSPDPLRPLLGYTEPLDGGTLLAYVSDGFKPGCSVNCGDRIVEMDTAGDIVWEYTDTEGRFLHHDFERLSNGNTMILCSRELDAPDISDIPIIDDCLVEVDQGGNVVWQWQTANHIDEIGFSAAERQLISDAGGDWAHANGAGVIPDDTSNPDPRFRPGNVFIQFQGANLLIVIDKDTKEIVWSLKDVAIAPHGMNFMTDNMPSRGDFLVFDNGSRSGYPPIARTWSRVLEIDPTDDSIQFEYNAGVSGSSQLWSFYSHFKGAAQRLPNGNTMITEGSSGRVFEVNPAGNIVWEFVNPVDVSGNDVYRAVKVPLSWPGLAE